MLHLHVFVSQHKLIAESRLFLEVNLLNVTLDSELQTLVK
jgi:hypothetical protein